MPNRGKPVRVYPETEAAIAAASKEDRPDLLRHGLAYAVNVLVMEVLNKKPPPTPRELKASSARAQQAQKKRT